MNATQQRLTLAFILLFGFCARAATFKSPLLDAHSWRQADTASISRNFYRERFNILYPQVDWRGDRTEGTSARVSVMVPIQAIDAAAVTALANDAGSIAGYRYSRGAMSSK